MANKTKTEIQMINKKLNWRFKGNEINYVYDVLKMDLKLDQMERIVLN